MTDSAPTPGPLAAHLIDAITRGLPTYEYAARNLLNEHNAHVRAEAFREAAERLGRERAAHVNRAIFCDGIEHAATLLTEWAGATDTTHSTTTGDPA